MQPAGPRAAGRGKTKVVPAFDLALMPYLIP